MRFAFVLALVPAGCGGPTAATPAPAARAAAASAPKPAAVCCVSEPGDLGKPPVLARVTLPDVALIDQRGRPARLLGDLIGDRVAAIQFVFTRCTTTCPVLGGQFRGAVPMLGDRLGRDFALISVTVDPEYDDPGRLKAWGDRFGAVPGWSLVTGSPGELGRLRRAAGAPGGKADHLTRVLVVDGSTGSGLTTDGLAGPAGLVQLMKRVRAARPDPAKSKAESASGQYFTDTEVVDQSGRRLRFYSDLLRDRVVVINVFFASCNGSCRVMGATLGKLQEALGDRMERDVRLISITVDPRNDTPGTLAGYAESSGAGAGRYFLTGAKPDVDAILRKLGQYVETREAHGTVFLVGNLRTGLWKKVFALAPAEEVIAQVRSVLDDRPAR